MWPLGSTLRSFSTELRVPGQDTQYAISANAGWPSTAYAGIYFNRVTGNFVVDGWIARRNNTTYTSITSPASQVGDGVWIAADYRAYIDPSDYEFRFINVEGDTGFLTGFPFYTPGTYGGETGWQSGELNPYWLLSASGPEFGTQNNSVTGIISVREKANPTNLRTGSLLLSASYEGNQ
jgi:hypothetical protein